MTIALALAEAGWFERMPIEIHASDANHVAIEKARQGIYSKSRMAGLSAELLSRYFTSVSEGLRVKPAVYERVTWSVTNLMSENEIAELETAHVIFCCKVFIYFSEHAVFQTLCRFGERMPDGGYLFSDGGDYFASLISQVPCFERQSIPRASVWKKRNIE